jgi:predicted NBD/HSP70 family sugar kinase
LPVSADSLLIAVDLGGTNLRVELVDRAGVTLADAAVPTNGDGDGSARALVARIGAVARALAEDAGVGWNRVGAAGIGVPGVADGPDLHLAPNLPSFADVPLDAALRDELGVPVVVENDVNLAALGEHRRGRAIGVDDFVLIAVGTGVGMGVVAGGVLQRGARGAAGEIAVLPVGPDPFAAANQVHGPLEEAAGGVGVARRYAERTAVTVDTLEVFARAGAGDPDAQSVLDEQARALALAVVAVQGVLDPALVLFGGGIGTRTDVLARVRADVARLTPRVPPVEVGALGARAGIVGAAQLAADLIGAPADA